MTFTPGKSGNPRGRPKGSVSGRMRALAKLDEILAKQKNTKAIGKGLEKELQDDPALFFQKYVMPLLPREAKVALDSPGVVVWRSLVTPPKDAPVLPPPEKG